MKKPCCKCLRGAPYSGEWDEATQCRECYLYANLPEYRGQCDGGGPGTELKKLIDELGLSPMKGCGCSDKAAIMDSWGVEGCKANRATIVSWLQESSEQLGWLDMLKVVAKGILTCGSLVDIAIERAEIERVEKTKEEEDEPVKFGSFAIYA